jgi:hypothetical protein
MLQELAQKAWLQSCTGKKIKATGLIPTGYDFIILSFTVREWKKKWEINLYVIYDFSCGFASRFLKSLLHHPYDAVCSLKTRIIFKDRYRPKQKACRFN